MDRVERHIFGVVGCVYNDKLFFLVYQTNVLCIVDLITGKTIRHVVIPYQTIVSSDVQYTQMVMYKDELILFPGQINGLDRVLKYSIKEDKFYAIGKMKFNSAEEKNCFYAASVVGDDLICMPGDNSFVYSINLRNGAEKKVCDICDNADRRISVNHVTKDNFGNFYCAESESNKVFYFDYDAKMIKTYELDVDRCCSYPVIAYLGQKIYWFSNRGGDGVYVFDLNKQKIVKKIDIEMEHAYLFSCCEKYIICDSGTQNKYKIYDKNMKLLKEGDKDSTLVGMWLTINENSFLRFDISDHRVDIFNELSITRSYVPQVPINVILESSKYTKIISIKENELVNLKYFLSCISTNTHT